jgi:uncharacterized glyoxalase superfamily protein PhnB
MWSAVPILGVKSVRKSAEHYRDALGFKLDSVFQPSADEPDGVYAIVERSGVFIHFQIRHGEMPLRERGVHERDVYLYVDRLDALHADLKRRGANVTQPPHLAPHGIREMIVEDLDGFRLAFGELAR